MVLLDLYLPDVDGVALIGGLRRNVPQSRVAVLTTEDGGLFVQDALAAGATGYVLKVSPPEEMCRMVLKVGRGGTWIDRWVASNPVASSRQRFQGWGGLTSQERQVARLLLDHRGDISAVAAVLVTSEGNVRFHLSNIYRKLGCRGLPDLLLQLGRKTIRIMHQERS